MFDRDHFTQKQNLNYFVLVLCFKYFVQFKCLMSSRLCMGRPLVRSGIKVKGYSKKFQFSSVQEQRKVHFLDWAKCKFCEPGYPKSPQLLHIAGFL